MGAGDIDFKDCVKSIQVKIFYINDKSKQLDTIYPRAYQAFFDRDKNITKRLDFWGQSKNPWQTIEYDKKERIIRLERKEKNQISLIIKQFFSRNLIYPDSTNFYTDEKLKFEQYINHFNNNLIVKQEYYNRDTLRNYTTFDYDSKNRITKEIYNNTINGFGIILDKSFTGGKTEKHLTPNDSIIYKYEKKLDTLIIYEYKANILEKVKKNYKSNELDLDIENNFWKGKLKSSFLKYKWKDSLKTEYLRFNNKLEISEYKNIVSSKNKIIKKWKNSLGENIPKNVEVKTILIKYDKFGNWIDKTYLLNKTIIEQITRNIKYYCH